MSTSPRKFRAKRIKIDRINRPIQTTVQNWCDIRHSLKIKYQSFLFIPLFKSKTSFYSSHDFIDNVGVHQVFLSRLHPRSVKRRFLFLNKGIKRKKIDVLSLASVLYCTSFERSFVSAYLFCLFLSFLREIS